MNTGSFTSWHMIHSNGLALTLMPRQLNFPLHPRSENIVNHSHGLNKVLDYTQQVICLSFYWIISDWNWWMERLQLIAVFYTLQRKKRWWCSNGAKHYFIILLYSDDTTISTYSDIVQMYFKTFVSLLCPNHFCAYKILAHLI